MKRIFECLSITPEAVAAGDSEELQITIVIGPEYTPGPSRLIFDMPGTLGMSRPSLLHEEEPGLINIQLDNPHVSYEKQIWDIEGQRFTDPQHQSYRGMAARLFVLNLSAGLKPGDTLKVDWGYTKGGYGTGTMITTVVPTLNYDAEIHVRYFIDPQGGLPDLGRSLPGSLRPEPDAVGKVTFRVLPREPRKLRILRPHNRALVLPLDRFGNLAEIENIAELAEAEQPLQRNASGAYESSRPQLKIKSRFLPLSDSPPMTNVYKDYNLYWGDIHTHSAFSNDCVEREKLQMGPADLMQFARDRAGLDFYAVTDHHQPWDIERNKIGRELWNQTVAATEAVSADGEFLVFTGIEYRCPRGDTAVVFGWNPGYDEIDKPEWSDIRKLWEGLRGKDYLAIPHFHNPGQLADAEWWQGPEAAEPVLEIFSCHGSFEMDKVLEQLPALCKRRRHDRNGVYLLERGIRYGLCANSDGHKGHVGSNGLTAVFAKELTKAAILEAYRARRVYGTTNARIRLVFTGNGELMGGTLPNSAKKVFTIAVTGENDLKKVELISNGRVVDMFVPEGNVFEKEHMVSDPAPGYWYVRATQQDNHVAWSSPVWFE